MKRLLTLFMVFALCGIMLAQDVAKREFRGAWIALVRNEDWPSKPGLTTEQQKAELIAMLDKLDETNINSVFFQVRPECDAIYESSFEPWSYWLTGEQGKAPDPYYDPLQFAIEEAHKRGLEIHAWFNPYRSVGVEGQFAIDENHISKTKPEWNLKVETYTFLNPGLPEVREYTTKVIMEVVRKYDVDGVHLDDYFYPYKGITTQDAATFQQYPRGIADINDWRRDNVNLLVEMLSDSVHTAKPNIKFGISPFGIWKNGVPAGIVGLDAYNRIYCDAVTWMENNWMDYNMPQLYWKFGGAQDYGKLMPWWATKTFNRHLYPGLAYYKDYAPEEYARQIEANRAEENCQGQCFFKASNFVNNTKISDYLRDNSFKSKALVPNMPWKEQVAPNAPVNVAVEKIEGDTKVKITWETPAAASDGDLPFVYAVYMVNKANPTEEDLKGEAICDITGVNEAIVDKKIIDGSEIYLCVTGLDKNYNESAISEAKKVEIAAPAKPALLLPADKATDQPDEVKLQWDATANATYYSIYVSDTETFDSLIVEKKEYKETSLVITGIEGQKTYYWKVVAANLGGDSEFSEVFSFTTGFPIPPVSLYPEDKNIEVSTRPTFTWHPAPGATKYTVEIYNGTMLNPSAKLVEYTVTDTFCVPTDTLAIKKYYGWRVASDSDLGFGGWSDFLRFKVSKVAVVGVEDSPNAQPKEYTLEQNYPNPFNPTTTISYNLIAKGNVSITVYDVLGNEVAQLVNEVQGAGTHSVEFNAAHLASGVYLYKIQSGSFTAVKKLMLLK